MGLMLFVIAAFVLPVLGGIAVLWGGLGSVFAKKDKHRFHRLLLVGACLLGVGIWAYVQLAQTNFGL